MIYLMLSRTVRSACRARFHNSTTDNELSIPVNLAAKSRGKTMANTNERALLELNGKPPLKDSLPFALQHLAAMILGAISPCIIIAGNAEPDEQQSVFAHTVRLAGARYRHTRAVVCAFWARRLQAAGYHGRGPRVHTVTHGHRFSV